MGYPPAAIGAKCAVLERPVVCFTGDGGVYYHLTELDTALRYGINPVIVVNWSSPQKVVHLLVWEINPIRNMKGGLKWLRKDTNPKKS